MKIPEQNNRRTLLLLKNQETRRFWKSGAGSCHIIFLFLILALINGCITEFIPAVTEQKQLLVVEGLITDQPGADTVKLSLSMPLGKKSQVIPLSGCLVNISDDHGINYHLTERSIGKYITDSATFIGVVGRSYTLHITTTKNNAPANYESYPSELKPVPPIDSLYYEKIIVSEKTQNDPEIDACQIYLDTHDPENKCKFFRWDFSETWLLRLLWPVDNMTCWITENSNTINIKNTGGLSQTIIDRYPINYISNETDRLKREYSINVNQYSLNEDEFNFWEKLQSLTQQVGGLYDIIPSTIPSNLTRIEDPNETVLGYFSVSSISSKRIFIKDNFSGIIDMYAHCIGDTVPTDNPADIPSLNITEWALLVQHASFGVAPMTIITYDHGCADCTVRGSNIRPSFWVDEK
ncbi:MAG: DUF4249 domain-containing protein [Bacteroidales bacterium]|jgi:hypothetical protein